LVHVCAHQSVLSLEGDSQNRKYEYQINFTQALSKSKGPLALLFYNTGKKIMNLIVNLQNIFQRNTEPIRPGRKYPRNHKTMMRKFFMAYKPIG
jgi:hypothetical protein